MSKESEILRRLTAVEEENRSFREWKAKCDRAALRWGGFAMGVLTIGAILVTGFDKASEKIIALLGLAITK